jgi:hypothetical protein
MWQSIPMAGFDHDSLSRLAQLAMDVDRDFEAIRRRRGSVMQCGPGCSDCCRARLSITRVEERFLRRGLAKMAESERAELARRAEDARREMCPALDPQGRCQVYDSRPLICRSFGVPLRRRREVIVINPPVIDVCDLNFVDIPVKTLSDADVLDQTSLEVAVSEIDADYCERHGLPFRERVPIAQILATPDRDRALET